jgi:hypothetical protein
MASRRVRPSADFSIRGWLDYCAAAAPGCVDFQDLNAGDTSLE